MSNLNFQNIINFKSRVKDYVSMSDEFFFLITGDRDLSEYAGAAVGAVARANEQRWILTELGRLENVTKLGKVEFLIILEYLSRILIKKFFYQEIFFGFFS